MKTPDPRRAALSVRLLLPFLACCLAAAPAGAREGAGQAPPSRTWTDEAELGIVMTTGNAETRTFSLKNTLEGKWERSTFRLKVAGLKADSVDETRFAVGSGTDHDVRSDEETNTTAEAYEITARGERRFGRRQAWFGEGSWQRNEFAGFSDRLQLTTGLTTAWKEGPRVRFKTDAGLSWTKQDDVVARPAGDDSWLGLRLGSLLRAKFGQSAEYGNDLVVDLNLDETDDLRVDMTNWISVAFTKRLALKVSHRLLFDGDPQLEEIDLFDPADLTTPIGKVSNGLDEVDTILTASLVVTF